MKPIKKNYGLTMLELLIVMAIIGIMATFGITMYPGTQKTARDTQRRSDLKQYQTALQTYANRHSGLYPGRTSSTYASDLNGVTPNLCVTDLNLSQCPPDPRMGQLICSGTGQCDYFYVSNGTDGGAVTSPSATQYVLFSRLEKKVNDQYVYFVICGNGTSGTTSSSWTPTSACPL